MKIGLTKTFLNYKHLELKLTVFSMGCIAAKVSYIRELKQQRRTRPAKTTPSEILDCLDLLGTPVAVKTCVG